MNKRLIAVLTSAITLALAGLVFIQWRWISGTIALKDQQFGENVDNALIAVSDRMDRIEAEAGVRGHEAGRRMILHLDSLDQVIQEDIVGPSDPSAMEFDTLDMAWRTAEDDRDSLINDVVRGLLSTEMFGDMDNDRIDPRLLDSLIHDELLRRGIHERYEHAVIAADGTTALLSLLDGNDSTAVLATAHRTRLFRNDIVGEVYWLHLHLPDQQRLVLRSMWPLLAASALFILLIAAAFIYTLLTIWKQKRLGDIRNDLVNNLTHELKTPISTIALACEALNDPGIPKSPEQLKLFTDMNREENKRLGVLVESVLQSAVADSGRMRLKVVDLDMHAVLADVVRNSAISAENKGGRMELLARAELSHVQGDRTHLANVFYNLLDNAVKYCEREPMVTISTRSDAQGVTVIVKDNGVGIPRNEQRKVFDRLYRVPTGDRHNVKGFGLGLSYVKAVVERHGGDIRLESEPGHGSIFSITLPFLNMDNAIKLLLCEDDPNLGSLLAQYLAAKDFVVEHRKDGKQGWEAYTKGSFDLLILDVMMPLKDGFTLAREIRQRDEKTPIIFLTAKSMKQDTITGFQAGGDDYLTKPFSMEELILRVHAVLKRSRGLAPKEAAPTRYELGNFLFDVRKQTLTNAAPASLFGDDAPGKASRKLTTKETDLLRMLCVHRNGLLPRTDALNEVWGDDNYFNGRSMDVYIAKLRKYLHTDPRVEILNVHGKGFRLITKED